MFDELGEIYSKDEEELVRAMRTEFLEEAVDNLRALDIGLAATRQGSKDMDDLVNDVRRLTLPLRGQAPNYGARLMGIVAHRMENYVGDTKTMTSGFFDDVQTFIDTLLEFAEGRARLDADPSEIVRALPAKFDFVVDDIETRNVEVMLVMLHGAATHFVNREMQQCGYRVSTFTSPFDGHPVDCANEARPGHRLGHHAGIGRDRPRHRPRLDAVDAQYPGGAGYQPGPRGQPPKTVTRLDPQNF